MPNPSNWEAEAGVFSQGYMRPCLKEQKTKNKKAITYNTTAHMRKRH